MTNVYVTHIVYKNGKTTGDNYQVVSAHTKKDAIEKALKLPLLTKCECLLVDIKKADKCLVKVIAKHNQEVALDKKLAEVRKKAKIKGETNE